MGPLLSKLGLSLGFVTGLALCLFANVYLHELGHFLVADALGMGPEMNIGLMEGTTGSRFNSELGVAYVTYASNGNFGFKDGLVASAGPLVNLLLGFVSLGLYSLVPKSKRRMTAFLALLGVAVPSFLAFLFNILPLAGTDGSLILKALGL